MYWREIYPTHQHADNALVAHENGAIVLMPAQRLAAEAAVRDAMLNGLDGGLKSIFKKVTKVAAKLSPSHQILKKVAPKAMAFSPSQMLLASASKKSAPKQNPAAIPETVAAPIAADVAPVVTNQSMLPFAQGGGGGGGFVPSGPDTSPAVAADTGPNWWLIGGGVVALGLIVYLLTKKGR